MSAAEKLRPAPRERPILFSGPMVRAILEGRKTQTRRAVRTKGHEEWSAEPWRACPYGTFGDRLWVRETWASSARDWVLYRASPDQVSEVERKEGGWIGMPRWRPSIHMPRWASRITLEVTGVRVERLQDIKAGDSAAEGIENTSGIPPNTMGWVLWHLECFKELWNSINGPGSWDANPWVWVIEFRRVAP